MSKIMDKVICKFENDGYSEIDIPRLLNISPLEFDRYKEDAKCVRIKDALYISDKILHLRIFEDENNKMNLSLLDTKGALMIVSQFTLYGDSRHGRRPSFTEAELPKQASRLYEHVVRSCRIEGIKVETGNFQTHMQVALENDGPVTLLLDSKKLF